MPAQADIQKLQAAVFGYYAWIPASAGMTPPAHPSVSHGRGTITGFCASAKLHRAGESTGEVNENIGIKGELGPPIRRLVSISHTSP